MPLFRFVVKHEHAIESHKPFYNNDDFEVVLMTRRQYFDVFPLNFIDMTKVYPRIYKSI